jgi:hypothetical protein
MDKAHTVRVPAFGGPLRELRFDSYGPRPDPLPRTVATTGGVYELEETRDRYRYRAAPVAPREDGRPCG